ncbi:MAG: hypothetical protein DME33_03300 [Verrucomicrobia bacterium]|nr:MAG: hypothetical protein DME33_03300 [Verrucomicrobiota bacterium]
MPSFQITQKRAAEIVPQTRIRACGAEVLLGANSNTLGSSRRGDLAIAPHRDEPLPNLTTNSH